jgi:hypothetical protein
MSEFANFLASNAGGGGSGAGFMRPPNVILPPNVNVSQVGGGGVAPYVPLPSNNVSNTNNTSNPFDEMFSSAPAASSSSSSSSAPIDGYGTYRNYAFNPNFDTNNYGAAYDPAKRGSKLYDKDLRSTDQYGQNYDISELNLGGFKDRLKKSKKKQV